MEIIYIIPINGILAAIGVLLILGAIWLWGTATEYENALIDFANESSDTVVIIIGIVVVLLALFVVLMKYSETDLLNKRKKLTFPIILEIAIRTVLLAAPFGMGLSGIYAWSIFWVNSIVSTLSGFFLMWLCIPFVILVLIAGVFIGCIPAFGVLAAETIISSNKDPNDSWYRFLLPAILDAAAILAYIYLVGNCTPLPEYVVNSFSAW